MEKIWLKNYPKGMPTEIKPDSYQSIIQIFDESVETYRYHDAFYNLGSKLNFDKIQKYSIQLAAYFQQELKLKKGDRVAIMLPNILQYPVVLLAALRAGLIVVNVNPLYTAHELSHQLKDSGAETIIVLANFANTVEKALPNTQLKNIIVTYIGDFLSFPKSLMIHLVLKYVHKRIPDWSIPNATTFKHALKKGKSLNFNPVQTKNEDIAFLQYTGGTTGVSKGAMLTHRNIISNILQADAWFEKVVDHGNDIIITALPLYHIFSLTANCLFISRKGGLNVLITNPRDITTMIKEMGKFKFTSMSGVNTLFNALLNHPKFAKLDFSHLTLTLSGGMALQEAVATRWQAVTGNTINEAYGLTETSPFVSANPTDIKQYNGTVGMPAPSTDVCLFDDEGHELGINQPGELAIKGPQVMLGYWQKPSETKKAFNKDGWLLTGDIASINEKGYIHILERKKDMILVSGFNVYPNEVEDVLVKIPGVVEAAVIGVSDEKSGEAVRAFIVKDDPNLTAETIINNCREMLTAYKVPKYIEFRDDLPKTNVGKILRRALKSTNMKVLEINKN